MTDLATALRTLLATNTVESCHAALAESARVLDEGAGTLLAAELARTPYGAVVLWRNPVATDEVVLLDWFARAQPGRLRDYGHGAGLVLGEGDVFVALIADLPPPPDLERALRDLAGAAAAHIARLRRDGEMQRRRRRLDDRDAEQAALLRAGADLTWQTGADGILHVTQIFHDRRDLALKLEGRSIADLLAGETSMQALMARGQPLRGKRVSLRGTADSFSVTCAPGPTGGWHGTLADDAPDRLAIDARTLETILDARQREEQLRRETETMMLGLRLLMGDLSFREKLEQLALHLACAIRCDDVRMIQHRPGEKPRLVLPEVPPLDDTLLLQRLLGHCDSRAVSILPSGSDDAAFLRIALDMRAGDIVLVALPVQSERYYLLCRARQGLTRGDQEVAERISLLLQQAIILQGDQTKMIHTAKLSALGQMSTSIAHELRQPLNTISIAAQNLELMAEMETTDPEILREKSARILSQIERACKVMDRMRRFGRKTVGDHRPASLAGIVRSARSLMDRVTVEGGIALEIEVDDSLQVMADELEIEQVLVNLIQNSADAIHEHSKEGRIRVYVQDDPDRADMLRLQVEDSGPGFPPHVLTHALDAFFTTKPEGKGTGLGLSIAHAILREHGGRLLIGNGEMGGRVTLILPRATETVVSFPARSAS